jgi:hypothetical protein
MTGIEGQLRQVFEALVRTAGSRCVSMLTGKLIHVRRRGSSAPRAPHKAASQARCALNGLVR